MNEHIFADFLLCVNALEGTMVWLTPVFSRSLSSMRKRSTKIQDYATKAKEWIKLCILKAQGRRGEERQSGFWDDPYNRSVMTLTTERGWLGSPAWRYRTRDIWSPRRNGPVLYLRGEKRGQDCEGVAGDVARIEVLGLIVESQKRL